MDLSIFDFYRNTMEKPIFVNICQYLSIFIGEETDLEFVKSFTPAGSKYQICGGGVEK